MCTIIRNNVADHPIKKKDKTEIYIFFLFLHIMNRHYFFFILSQKSGFNQKIPKKLVAPFKLTTIYLKLQLTTILCNLNSKQ